MLGTVFYGNYNGFIHFIADNYTGPDFSSAPFFIRHDIILPSTYI
jgi:hypothetical protein